MMQKLLYHVLPALLPFAFYVAYVIAVRRGRAGGGVFDDAPWYWLTLTALVLMIISMLAFWYTNVNVAAAAGGRGGG